MRVTGGCWRSRRLVGPTRGMPLRPTPDALRERGFAILGSAVEGARFLDLFAGTGAVGLEALSRGATATVFVEMHRAAARIIRGNCDALAAAPPAATIIVAPALRAVQLLKRSAEVFDLAWADPPFDRWTQGAEALILAADLGVLGVNSTACLECPDAADPALLTERFDLLREVSSGASRLLMLRIRKRNS